MIYTLQRYGKNRDHIGNIVSIVIEVSVFNGIDTMFYEYQLTEQEQALVLAVESNLKPILERCFAIAELRLENEIATRPQPTIFLDVIKRNELRTMIELPNIAIQKTVNINIRNAIR